jgi:hypothetical protein
VISRSQAIPSSTALTTSSRVLAKVRPTSAPRACGAAHGALAPARWGIATTGDGSGPASASRRSRARSGTRVRRRAQSTAAVPFGLRANTPVPGRLGCGPTAMPASAMTAGRHRPAGATSDSHVPHASSGTPGATAPDPTAAHEVSKLPTTTWQPSGRPSSAAAVRPTGPSDVAHGRTSGMSARSRSSAASLASDQSWASRS